MCAIVALASLLPHAACAKVVTYLWDYARLEAISHQPGSKEYASLVSQARKAIAAPPTAVTQKTRSISGDPHNFESLSIYWWPDTANPSGPYICKDGFFNPEYKLYDLPRLLKLKDNLTATAQAYFVSRDRAFYDYFCLQLDTWFIDSSTRMNPNFEYGQFIPGLRDNRGNPAGIIDAYAFIDIIESIRLTDAAKSIGRRRMKALRRWFEDFGRWMQQSEIGRGERRTTNNHGIAYDVTLYAIALFTGDSATQADVEASVGTRVASQIAADGAMPAELRRTRAFHYSIYNLTHIIDFLMMSQRNGRPATPATIDRVRRSIAFLDTTAATRAAFPYQEVGDWNTVAAAFAREKARFQAIH